MSAGKVRQVLLEVGCEEGESRTAFLSWCESHVLGREVWSLDAKLVVVSTKPFGPKKKSSNAPVKHVPHGLQVVDDLELGVGGLAVVDLVRDDGVHLKCSLTGHGVQPDLPSSHK